MNTDKARNKEYRIKSIADVYGSRRGFITSTLQQLLNLSGWYSQYKRVNWELIERLVFVCQGNICRSPYAEALANRLRVNAISCGIDTVDGKPANEMAIEVAAQKGIDLSTHKARRLSSIAIKPSDLVIAMDDKQAKYLGTLLGEGSEITLMGLWGSPVNPYINDPFGKSYTYFENCFDFIEGSLNNIVSKLSAKTQLDCVDGS
jgi:protein-tyrosine phosphatase